MPVRNIPRLLLLGFHAVHGWTLMSVGLALDVGGWLIPIEQNATVSQATVVRYSVAFGGIIFMGIATLFGALWESEKASRIPRAIGTKPAGQDQAIILLEPSELYGYNTIVSIYHVDQSGFEELISVGRVYNIQEDGKVQVLSAPLPDSEVARGLMQNNQAVLQQVRVKPSAQHDWALQ